MTNKPHVSHNSGNNEWYTPEELIISARKVFGGTIDLDPASSEIANKVVRATVFYTKDNNGLDDDKLWLGNTWMNPPYSSKLIKRFCEKLVTGYVTCGVTSFITLTNNATETALFKTLYDVADYYCFLNKRVRFIDPSGKASGQPLQGQVICYAGNNGKVFVNEFAKHGLIMKRQSVI